MNIRDVPGDHPISFDGDERACRTDPLWLIWFTQVYNAIKAFLQFAYFVQTASKTVANSTTETTLVSTGEGLTTLPAGFLMPGKCLRVRACGVISTTGTPNLTLRLKIGGATIASTGAVAMAGTVSGNVWSLDAEITCRTRGASGTVIGQGEFQYDDSTHAGTRWGMAMAAAATVDTTTQQAVDLTAQWGTGSASNTITCTNLNIEASG